MMRKGLVLEGGAMRGLFSAGVMDVMMEHGIEYDGIVGVSAGAAFGCNYVSRQIGRSIRYNKMMANNWRYCSIRSCIFDNEAFEANPTAFYVVCTDVETGEAVYQRCDKGGHTFFDWVRASASMPMVSRVVPLGGHLLLDGGVADSIPLAFFEREGYDRNVVILTQPAGYQKGHNRLMPLMRMSLRHYPNMVRALDQRHIMYNNELDYVAQREQAGAAYVIRPDSALQIGHISHNPAEMQAVYDEGRKKGEAVIEEIKAFLERE